ncbi:hypothetical protein Y032_0713g1749 [Ancylostoma ceylanicum]|uniref:Uncharacterized protein n=1 Tax=Ancylostoma ceylanicum TaxID=53326 RepID=A0A016WGV3_9BILA|nr:hypothetical protein Y032_0713g1749 [Ancylostoma ceylanicum]
MSLPWHYSRENDRIRIRRWKVDLPWARKGSLVRKTPRYGFNGGGSLKRTKVSQKVLTYVSPVAKSLQSFVVDSDASAKILYTNSFLDRIVFNATGRRSELGKLKTWFLSLIHY